MRGVEDHRSIEPRRVAGDRPPGDHPAPVVADHRGPLAAVGVDQADDVIGQDVEGVGLATPRGLSLVP